MRKPVMRVTDHVDDSVLELYGRIDGGALRPAELRSPEIYTPTRMVDFAREKIRPLVEEPAVH